MSLANPFFAETNSERPFWPPRNWWLALLAILALAGALRYPVYDWALPYPDDVDEVYTSLSGLTVIDTGSARLMGHDGYPPAIINVYTFFLRFFQEPGTPSTTVIWMVRLLAITASLGAVVVLALLGYQTLGPPFGLVGAFFWTTTPFFIDRSLRGKPDIFLVFFSALAIWLAIVAALQRRERWSTYATYALMMAVLFKYTAAFMAPILLLLPLWQGRAGWRECFRNLVLFAAFSAWLIFLTPAFVPVDPSNPHLHWNIHTQFIGIPGPRTLWGIVRTLLSYLDPIVLFLGWVGVGILFMRRRREVTFTFAVLLLLAFTSIFVVGFWGDQGDHSKRFLTHITALLVFSAGLGYVAWANSLYTWWVRRQPQRRILPGGVTLLLLTLVFLPQLQGSVETLRRFMQIEPRNFVRDYMDLSLASGRYVISHATNKIFNRDWGGYAGETAFELASYNPATTTSVVHWREKEVDYAILHYDDYDRLSEADPFDYLGQTTRLKGWEHQPNYRSPAMVVLLLQPIQHSATGQLGPIRLLGYDLDEGSFRPGAVLPFHLYWQATAATEVDYQVFNHLLDDAGNLIAQADGPPLPDPLLRRGTKDWDDPEEIIYSREYLLALPENLAPGEYTLVTGFYRRETGLRLLSPTGEDALWVARIEVE